MKAKLSLKDLLSVVFAVIALMSIAACSPGSSSSNLEGEVPEECLYTPDQGSDVDVALAADTSVDSSGFFEKKYSPTRLNSVLNTSIVATIRFAKASGLSLYRVVAGKTHCDLYNSLENAPAAQQDYWDKASSGLPENVSLLGLFISSDKDDQNFEAGKTPTILINAGADRWTLVHEMTHANFNNVRRLDSDFRTDTEVGKSWIEDAKFLFAFADKKASPVSIDESLELSKKFANLAKDYIEFQRRFALEEITIESILLRAWSEDRMKFHASRSPKNGINYIRMKKAELEKDFKDLEDLHANLTEESLEFAKSELVVEGLKQLRFLAGELESVSSHSERIYSEKSSATNMLIGLAPQNQLMHSNHLENESEVEPIVTCNHGGINQEMIDEAFGRNRK